MVWPCDEKRRYECCKASNNNEGGSEETSMKAQVTTASTRPPLEILITLLSKLMSPHNHPTDRPRYNDAPSSGWAVIPTVETQGLSVLQLNAEGLTNAKLEVIRQLADSNQMAVVLLQETHRTTDDNLKLPGFLLAGSIPSKHHDMATFVRTGITWSAVNDLHQTQTSSGWSQRSKKQL